MKTSNIFLTTITILVPSLLFTFFLYNTRVSPEVNIILKIEENTSKPNLKDLKISKDSLIEIENVLEKTNRKETIEHLIPIFEREREHYILLISIISLILAVISTYFIFTRFVEKEEYIVIQQSIKNIDKEFKESLLNLKFNLVMQEIILTSASYEKKMILLDYDTKEKIIDKSQFLKYLNDEINDTIQPLSEFITSKNFHKIYPVLFNYTNSICIYCDHKKYETLLFDKLTENTIYQTLIANIKRIIGNNNFFAMKENWNKAHPTIIF